MPRTLSEVLTTVRSRSVSGSTRVTLPSARTGPGAGFPHRDLRIAPRRPGKRARSSNARAPRKAAPRDRPGVAGAPGLPERPRHGEGTFRRLKLASRLLGLGDVGP